MEDNIVYESVHLYVFRTGKRYEIRVNAGTHSVIVGYGSDREKVIRTAQRLERYPKNLRAFAGIESGVSA